MNEKPDPAFEKDKLKEVNILGFRFYIYFKPYRPGIESEIPRNMEIATLADKEGYYYCTLYGVDNLNVPFLVNYLPRFREMELEPGLTELVEVAKMSEKKGWIMLDEKNIEVLRKIDEFERLRSIEGVAFKSMLIRKAVEIASREGSFIVLVGSEKMQELQRLRKLGNGFAVYLNEKVRKMTGIDENTNLRLRIVDGRIVIEKVSE